MFLWLQILFMLFFPANELDIEKQYMLDKVNELRSAGCYCGRKYMEPVSELDWSNSLRESAFRHAKDMQIRRYFSHYSKEGKDVGNRLDEVGYSWEIAGENLGEGQRSFDEVFIDWIKSPEHCRMMMEPRVEEMGIARYGKYWVQHFGKQIRRRY